MATSRATAGIKDHSDHVTLLVDQCPIKQKLSVLVMVVAVVVAVAMLVVKVICLQANYLVLFLAYNMINFLTFFQSVQEKLLYYIKQKT